MSPDTLYVEQNGETHEVTPLGDGGQSVGSFYSYDQGEPASANTGLERSDVSQMFFYDGSGGTSLVFLHDEPNDGSGGSASVNLGSTPSGLSWVVKDNPFDSYSSTGASWNWAPCCTDGGAVRGGLDGEFNMSVSASFSGIDSWVFRDGSGGTFSLDPGESVTVASRKPVQEIGDTANFDFSIQNPVEQCNFQGANNAEFGVKNCEHRPSGKTPLLIKYDIALVCESLVSFDIDDLEIDFGETTIADAWIGIDPVTTCMWVGEEETGECTRLPGSCTWGSVSVVTLPMIKEVAEEAADWLQDNQGIATAISIAILVVILVVAIIYLIGLIFGIVLGAGAAALANELA